MTVVKRRDDRPTVKRVMRGVYYSRHPCATLLSVAGLCDFNAGFRMVWTTLRNRVRYTLRNRIDHSSQQGEPLFATGWTSLRNTPRRAGGTLIT